MCSRAPPKNLIDLNHAAFCLKRAVTSFKIDGFARHQLSTIPLIARMPACNRVMRSHCKSVVSSNSNYGKCAQ